VKIASKRILPFSVLSLILAAAALFGIWSQASQPTEATFQQAAVTAGDNFFQPQSLTVSAGTTVVWTSTGALPHTVTSDTGAFDSGTLNNGGTFQFTFSQPGTYPYYCEFHGTSGGVGMAGTIVVQGGQQATPTPAATGTPGATSSPATGTGTPRPATAPASGSGPGQDAASNVAIYTIAAGAVLLTLGGGVLAQRRIRK
jgi:plastocyanin